MKEEINSLNNYNELDKEKNRQKFTAKELKTKPGFEEYSDEELESIIDSMRVFCRLVFEIFQSQNS